MNIKKILLIILFIIIVFLLGLFLYLAFFKSAKIENIPNQQNATSTGSLPINQEGNVNVLENQDGATTTQELGRPITTESDEKISNVANGGETNSKELLSSNMKNQSFSQNTNGISYYDSDKQTFFRLLDDGTIEKLSDKKFYSVTGVTWSDKKNKAIIEYPDGTKILYDFNKDAQLMTFPKEMKDFDFSATEEKISAKWVGQYSDYNYVVSVNSDGSNLKYVEPMADQDKNVDIVWSPDNQVLATYRKYIDGQRQEVFFINEDGKNLSSLVVEGGGFKGTWNSSGDKLLYSVYSSASDYNPTLYVSNGNSDGLGSGKRNLGINTWVDKCDFSKSNSQSVYCAVPDYLPEGSGMSSSAAKGVPYSIYKINLSDGRKEKIAEPVSDGKKVSIDKIYINNNDSKLYYTNETNGSLYSIDLK